MSTYRERLEAAATAAGYVIESWADSRAAWVYEKGAALNADGEPPIFLWAPIDDDPYASARRAIARAAAAIGGAA